VGRLRSSSFDRAAACVTPPEAEFAGEGSVGPVAAGRFMTGRSESVLPPVLLPPELSAPEASSVGPNVGFPLESLAGRFITGRSESPLLLPLLVFELEVLPMLDPLAPDEDVCPLLPVSPPDPGARFSTGRPPSASPVITAWLGGFLARSAASFAAFAFTCASIGNSGCQVPSATQLPFTCFGIVTVNVPVGSPKLCASYTVCGSSAMGSGFAPYKLAS